MRKLFTFTLILFLPALVYAQIDLPLAEKTPPIGTSHQEMLTFLQEIVFSSKLIELEIGTKSTTGREIPVIYIPPKSIWKKEKATVMLFAEQHGNEPSGKEALLMLIHHIFTEPKQSFYNNLNLILIPMVNPDGNESYQRRNSRNIDLNRDHVILTEPETRMLHLLFNKYKPEVTLDIHEYGMDTWLELGYIKDFGEQLDCVSNMAIPAEFKTFSINEILQPTLKLTRTRGVNANRYLICRSNLNLPVRHSTTDIDDGRNSFGIQHSLSFILEGLNGNSRDDRIWERAKHQLTMIESFLHTCNERSKKILDFVNRARIKYGEDIPDSVIIQAEYSQKSSQTLEVVLKRVLDFKDTTVVLTDYRPNPEAMMTISRPEAYLIEAPTVDFKNLMQYHGFYYYFLQQPMTFDGEQFSITGVDTLHYEHGKTIIPDGQYVPIIRVFKEGSMVIPTHNMRANHIVQILEPKSFYGISHYQEFKYLLQQKIFPIYRLNTEN